MRKVFRNIFYWSGVVLLMACERPVDNSYFESIDNSSLDILVVNSYADSIIHEKKSSAILTIISAQSDIQNLTYRDLSEYHIEIKQRGWTSRNIPKSQFGFKVVDENSKNIDQSLLDIPAGNSWVLHGPYFDKSLMRNQLIYQLWEDFGHYSVRTRLTELYLRRMINDSSWFNKYMGVYLLTEKIEEGKNRVFLQKPVKVSSYDDISFILEMIPEDRLWDAEEFITTEDWNLNYAIVYPKKKKELKFYKQDSLIQDFMNDLEDSFSVQESGDKDPAYTKYIDVDSFVDYLLLNELANNPDAFYASVFLHKDINGKLKAGPAWDYNVSCGVNMWTVNPNINLMRLLERHFEDEMMASPFFQKKYKERWLQLRKDNIVSSEKILSMIDENLLQMGDAPRRNFEIYNILGENLKDVLVEVPVTYDEEIIFLRNYFTNKIDKIDQIVGKF